jgi:hypothetical protein
MWLGTFNPKTMSFGQGTVYNFPRSDKKGEIKHCNVEGVTLMPNGDIVTVSDAAKSDQDKRCKEHEMSIARWRIPRPSDARGASSTPAAREGHGARGLTAGTRSTRAQVARILGSGATTDGRGRSRRRQ